MADPRQVIAIDLQKERRKKIHKEIGWIPHVMAYGTPNKATTTTTQIQIKKLSRTISISKGKEPIEAYIRWMKKVEQRQKIW